VRRPPTALQTNATCVAEFRERGWRQTFTDREIVYPRLRLDGFLESRFTAEPPGATGLTLSRSAFTIVISSAFTVNMPFTPRPGPPTTDSGRPQSIIMSPYPMVHHEKCTNVQIREHFTARPENAPTVNNLFTVRQYHHNMVPRAFGYAKQVPM